MSDVKDVVPLPNNLKLTSSSTTINGIKEVDSNNNIIPKYTPNGSYKVTSSSVISLTNQTNMPFNIFNNNNNDATKFWQTDVSGGTKKNGGDTSNTLLYNYPAYTQNPYNSSIESKGDVSKLTAPYQGGGDVTKNTWSTTVDRIDVPGEWVQIQLPYTVYLKEYTIKTPDKVVTGKYTSKLTFPRKFMIAGSTDGKIWQYVDQQIIDPTSTTTSGKFVVTTTKPYSYFRLIVSVMAYDMSTLAISSWFLAGMTTLPTYTSDYQMTSQTKSAFMTLSRAKEVNDIDYGNMNYMKNPSPLSYREFEGFDNRGYVAPVTIDNTEENIFEYKPGLLFTIYKGYHNEKKNYADTATVFTSLQPISGNNTTTTISGINNGTNGAISEYKNVDLYSVQWTGFFYTGNTTLGKWKFTINSDDGSYLWLNNKLIIENGGLHGMYEKSGTIELESTTYYPIKLLFGQNYGGHNIILSFTPPKGSAKTNGTNHYFCLPTKVLPNLTPYVNTIQNNQITPLTQIAKDYTGTFNNMIQGSVDLSGNINKITNSKGTGLRDELLSDPKYDYSGSSFNFGKEYVTAGDIRSRDTVSLAEQETYIYTLGAIASVSILIAAIYIAMD